MNTRTDADPNDDPAESTERPAEADAQPEAKAAEGPVAGDTSPEAEAPEDDEEFAHLDSLADGAGCAEVWEHLSETRGEE